MVTIEQLKSELKEKKWDKISIFCGLIRARNPNSDFIEWRILQAEISALKKGISACEEILNSQQTKPTSKLRLGNGKFFGERFTSNRNRDKTADTQTLIKQISYYKSNCLNLIRENDDLEKKRAYWEMRCKQEQEKVKEGGKDESKD